MYFQNKINQLKTRTFTADVNSIPWEEANTIYTEAADQAEAVALAGAKALYDKAWESNRRNALALAGIDETEASYEGDLNLEYNPPKLGLLERRKLRARAGNTALAEYFVKPYQIKSFSIKLLDQIIAQYSRHRLNKAGEGGTISGLQYLKDNLDLGSAKTMGMYRFLMMDARSAYLDRMVASEAKKYCTLVPFILYAHKLYNDVAYSQWDRETLHYVVNESLCEAMLTEVPSLGSERLCELRDIGLVQKGTKRNPVTTYALYRLKDTEIGHCNTLAKLMLCQTWAAHPNNRTKYMVLDPMDWDNMPLPLANEAIFDSTNLADMKAPVHASTHVSAAEVDPWI